MPVYVKYVEPNYKSSVFIKYFFINFNLTSSSETTAVFGAFSAMLNRKYYH